MSNSGSSSGSSSSAGSSGGMSSSSSSGIVGPILNLVGLGIQSGKMRSAAREQRGFEEEMSSTAYQRAVRDMRLAGLNPAMMYGGGGGAASTPSVQQAGVPDFSSIGTSALQSKLIGEQLDLMREQQYKVVTERDNIRHDTMLKNTAMDLNEAETRLKNANSALVEQALPEAKASGDVWRSMEEGAPAVKALQKLIEIFGLGKKSPGSR